jgi:ATP-binding cassette subfamily B protein
MALFYLLGTSAATLAGPALIGYGIDHGLKRGQFKTLAVISSILICTMILSILFSRAQTRTIAKVGEMGLRDLRIRLFSHIMSLSISFFTKIPAGKLVARMTSDFDAMEDLVQQGLVVFVTNALLFFVTLIVLAVMSWQLFLITLLTLPPLIVLSRWFEKKSKIAYLQVRERIGNTLTNLQEGIAGVKVIQAFGRQEHTVESFSDANQAQLSANLKAVVISIKYFPVLETTGVVSVALILGVGGVLVHDKIIAIGTVVAFILYLNTLYNPIQQMSQLYSQLQSSGAALSKVYEILSTQTDLKICSNPKPMPTSGDYELTNVSFKYGQNLPNALSNVNLKIEFGDHIAFVGPTGAGKSTLAKLICRFHDPTEGEITFASIRLDQMDEMSIRKSAIVVPQEGFLFSGTIADNIKIGKPDATEDDIYSALESIGGTSLLDDLPDGLNTYIFERGSLLSSGQKQLVSLARAALTDPKVLILDEATSNLDPFSARMIETALDKLKVNRTLIVIAHRLNTAMKANSIVVIDEGKIVEVGSHQDLVLNQSKYAELFSAWEKNVA